MRIKARMGISLDGYVATADGVPALAGAADFVPGQSHGYPDFITGGDAVAMGRETFIPALRAPQWPWGEMTVSVLTSRALPAGTPQSVVTSTAGPAGLVRQLRSRGSAGDVHLVGGPRMIQAFHQQEALDNLEVIVLPILLGDGVPLWPHGSPPPTPR